MDTLAATPCPVPSHVVVVTGELCVRTPVLSLSLTPTKTNQAQPRANLEGLGMGLEEKKKKKSDSHPPPLSQEQNGVQKKSVSQAKDRPKYSRTPKHAIKKNQPKVFLILHAWTDIGGRTSAWILGGLAAMQVGRKICQSSWQHYTYLGWTVRSIVQLVQFELSHKLGRISERGEQKS